MKTIAMIDDDIHIGNILEEVLAYIVVLWRHKLTRIFDNNDPCGSTLTITLIFP